MKRETRNFDINLEAGEDSRVVSGYAVVFDSESVDLGGFTEIIKPTALDGVIEKSDVLCVLNHNEDKGVLARSKYGTGSLTLMVDEKGLKYSFEVPHTALGDELLEGIKRGDITTSSFCFLVDEDIWHKNEDGTYLRTITKIKELFDVSPVYREAYNSTSVEIDKRGLDAYKDKEASKLKLYYNTLRKKIKK